MVLPTDAEDITYDLTNTPDLGSGDVQSAIEALDGKVEEVKEDVVRTGYLITSWEDDKILTSTTYAVGSTVGEWGNGVRYGCRGVRLNVKEGDKVLLDTYSPALFGLIFTDENRVVKALYDDRRFDGVWTAPVNGYCYIQDVLYRDNYHYASAHGHLAYMAHDARKRVAKGGDWYNEYAPRILGDSLREFSVTTNISAMVTAIDGNTTAYCQTARKQGTFSLIAYHIHIYADTASKGTVSNQRFDSSSTRTNYLNVTFSSGVEQDIWSYAIIVNTAASSISNALAIDVTVTTAGLTHLKIDKAFLHSSSDFAELYQLAQKIINGEVEVDNFYGVKEKEVDFVKNAIGLQSISDLGYNILDYGATLPIDEEGYKYAKEIYDRYKDNPPTGNIRALFANDEKLVYFPNIDLSHATAIGESTTSGLFFNCKNLKTVPPLNLTGTIAMAYTFQSDMSLKKVESLGNIKPTTMTNVISYCYSLEYVGKIDTSECTIFWGFLYSDYSLKRVEEVDVSKVSSWGSNGSVTWPGNVPNLEYMLIKNMFRLPSQTSHVFTSAPKWGINSKENPDARQSLVDSLLTYSYDRVNDPDGLGTAGTTCTITLSANSYAQLTASEIEQITAKGYTLTHP